MNQFKGLRPNWMGIFLWASIAFASGIIFNHSIAPVIIQGVCK